MGNSKTSIGMAVQTDKQFYMPADTVNGKVLINCPQPYPCTKIILQISGLQKNWWNNCGVPSNETVIIRSQMQLSEWRGQSFLHGQYCYPFEFRLPAFIPGSFKEQNDNYKAKIDYLIRCEIVSSKKQYPNVQKTKEITIRQNRKGAEYPLYGEILMFPETCCCQKQGVSKVNCYFEKNQYLAGENCVVICEANNQKCKTGLKPIKIKFQKWITLNSKKGQVKHFTTEINQMRFPAVRPKSSYINEHAEKLVFPLKYKKPGCSITPSTSGRLIKCQYRLEVCPQVDGMCANKCETFSVGVNILEEAKAQEQIEEPQNWSPETFKKSVIFLNEQHSNENLNKMNEGYKHM